MEIQDVYGITHGGEHGWNEAVTLVSFIVALVLGALFLSLQARSKNPMLPLGLFHDRNRSGSYATMLFVGAGLMGTFYLMTLFLQQVLRFGPLQTGLSSLPFSAGIILGAGISTKLVEKHAPRSVAADSSGCYVLALPADGGLFLCRTCPACALPHLLWAGVSRRNGDTDRRARRC